MSDTKYEEVISKGGLPLHVRIVAPKERIPHQVRAEDPVSERVKAIAYMVPDLEEREARVLAEREPRLSFHPRAIRDHVLQHIDDVVASLESMPAEVPKIV
jgi:hypothetical protein